MGAGWSRVSHKLSNIRCNSYNEMTTWKKNEKDNEWSGKVDRVVLVTRDKADNNKFIQVERIDAGEDCKINGVVIGGKDCKVIGKDGRVIAIKGDGVEENILDLSSSANQYDLSLIAGFGAPFHKNWYAGIEFALFKRFGERKKDNGLIGIKHSSIIGMDMDVRLGYLFPQSGNLLYVTIGFTRILGRATFPQDKERRGEVSFGSFYPTFGFGIEHKINHNWNIRGDFRISLTSKDDNKSHRSNKEEVVKFDKNKATDKDKVGYSLDSGKDLKFDAKPARYSFRISITRNI
ncbi:hypothetical protein FACS1894122_12350 [Alphaproteobacteria bacterium]|nr:hypothetical protein FACS1894122_12350 [Alphaproteobacteria bacterium]